MNTSFLSLYYFTVIAEEMNITRAASKLNITQQSLSNHIKKLEEQYEIRLFDRKPAFRLTVAGERLLRYAKKALVQETQLMNELKTTGYIRLPIGLPTIRLAPYLPDIYEAFSRIRPTVIPSYYTYGYREADAALRSGRIDLYYGIVDGYGKYGNRIPLVKDELFFCTSRELLQRVKGSDWRAFLVRHANGVSLRDIVDFPLVMPHPDSMLRSIFNSNFERLGISPRVVTELIDNNMSMDLCKRNYCAGFISKPLLYNYHRSGTISIYAFPVSDLEGCSSLNIVYSENVIPEYSRDYIECARNTILAKNAEIDAYFNDVFTRASNTILEPQVD